MFFRSFQGWPRPLILSRFKMRFKGCHGFGGCLYCPAAWRGFSCIVGAPAGRWLPAFFAVTIAAAAGVLGWFLFNIAAREKSLKKAGFFSLVWLRLVVRASSCGRFWAFCRLILPALG